MAGTSAGMRSTRPSSSATAQAERWGYHRYWLAEHSRDPGSRGSSAPEIMVARGRPPPPKRLRVWLRRRDAQPLQARSRWPRPFRVLETLLSPAANRSRHWPRAPAVTSFTARALQAGGRARRLSNTFRARSQDSPGISRPNGLAGGASVSPAVRREPPEPAALPEGLAPRIQRFKSGIAGGPISAAASPSRHFIKRPGRPAGDGVLSPAISARRRASAAPLGNIGVFAPRRRHRGRRRSALPRSRDLWRLRLDQGYLGPDPYHRRVQRLTPYYAGGNSSASPVQPPPAW